MTKDAAQSADWYRKAADQNDEGAQAMLGYDYHNGSGVPKDYVLSYMWLNLAAAHGGQDAIQKRAMLEKTMSPDQITAAKRLSSEWKPQYSEATKTFLLTASPTQSPQIGH